MRCKACNEILEDAELTRKDSNGDFSDLCNICYIKLKYSSGVVSIRS